MPASPALAAGFGRAAILTDDGELLTYLPGDARDALRKLPPPLLIHAPATFRRIGLTGGGPALDLLELFAFVLPARSTPPTPRGLALALDLAPPKSLEDAAALLPDIAEALLSRLRAGKSLALNAHAAGVAARMGRAGWLWAPHVARALDSIGDGLDGFRVWRRLPEWVELPSPPPPTAHPVAPLDARRRLRALLPDSAEQRPGQADYADAATQAFAPREVQGAPHMVLAEAGTGTGKTLGYIAPASLWAEKNQGAVWISTYTKLLQRQIESELTRLHPDPARRRQKIVVRKGRENYLCLLNLEDAVGAALSGVGMAQIVPLGLVTRWAQATADGDIQGGDLPGWFAELFGQTLQSSLADRRGECIYGACTHYKRCFVEHTVRRARTADLVVANHALVMAQAAWQGLDDDTVPTRYVLDEGHHLFEAADSAFASELSGLEGGELRRWLLGAEAGRSRARGLKRRLDEIVVGRPELEAPLEALLQAARALPSQGWSLRLGQTGGAMAGLEGPGAAPFEAFLQEMRVQILARLPGEDGAVKPGDSETPLFPVNDALAAASVPLERALARIAEPARIFMQRLEERLDADADELDTTTRGRIEAALRSLRRRCLDRITIWRAMLAAIAGPEAEPGDRPTYLYFLRLDRRDGLDRDVAFCRHHLDPTEVLAMTLVAPAHGVLVTSATLRDTAGDPEADWEAAEARVGARHLPLPAIRAAVQSPFDYARQTRAFVVTDVSPDPARLAAAYRELFLAAGGGALGLFTAISRLRAVHARIAPELEAAGIPVLAQHVDAMDNTTLVDIFRTEEHSCLLGTDAMRDGVDVPGRSLRLVVFERVPWPRPDILHRERRIHLGQGDPRAYDERVARLKLRQAFGRLIRSATDHGVFVLLDRRTPSRLLSALPADVQRVGLAEAIAGTRRFLDQTAVISK